MPSHHEHVRRALNSLSDALHPFVEREFRRVHSERWQDILNGALGADRPWDSARRDAYALLTLMWEHWRPVFRDSLSAHDRSLVSELRHYRNRWAHQEDFDFDDAYRVLDDARRLCESVDAPDAAAELTRAKQTLFDEHVGAADVATEHESEPRNNRFEIGVFIACGAALGLQVAMSFGSNAWPLALLSAVSFSYILIRRLQRARREHCAACGRAVQPHENVQPDA